VPDWMGSVILSQSGGARDGWVVMVVRTGVVCREQTVLLEQLFSPGHKMKFWKRIVRIGLFSGTQDVTRFTLPHIAQHLYVAGDLFPGPLYAGLLEIINEELVTPP